MKKLSKVISLLIATAMLFALAVPVLATESEPAPLATPVYKLIKAEGNTAIEGNKIEISKSTPIKLEKTVEGQSSLINDFNFSEGSTNVVSSDTSIITVGADGNNTTNFFRITPVKNSTTPVTITYTDADSSTATLEVTVSGVVETVDRSGLWFVIGGEGDTKKEEFYAPTNATNIVKYATTTDVSNGKLSYDFAVIDEKGRVGTLITQDMVTFGTAGVLSFHRIQKTLAISD